MADPPADRPNGYRRAQVLRALRRGSPMSTSEVARACDISISHARNLIRRLRKEDRLETETDQLTPHQGQDEHAHRLLDRGEEYLEWWVDQGRELPDLPGLRGV